MKIWEAILYGFFAGVTEILPVSFRGHAVVLQSIFALSPLTEGSGLYVRASICLGIALALALALRVEVRQSSRELLRLLGRKKRGRKNRTSPARRRGVLLGLVALAPALLALIYCAAAERITRLLYVALFFILNGLVIFLGTRFAPGEKTEKNATLGDALLSGAARLLAVFPGMSGVGLSLSVGQGRGWSVAYNLRFGLLLTLAVELAGFVYYSIRALAFGTFAASVLLHMLLALVISFVTGYLVLQYLKYLLQKKRLRVFAYYCWDAAAIVLILSLINA